MPRRVFDGREFVIGVIFSVKQTLFGIIESERRLTCHDDECDKVGFLLGESAGLDLSEHTFESLQGDTRAEVECMIVDGMSGEGGGNRTGDFAEEGGVLRFLRCRTPSHVDAEEMREESLRDVNAHAAEEDHQQRDPGVVLDEGGENALLAEAIAQDSERQVTKPGEDDDDGLETAGSWRVPPSG